MSYFIGLDLGTGAAKGVLYDGDKIIAGDSAASSFIRNHNAVEYDPAEHWQSIYGLICSLAEKSPEPVKAISMCAASGNTLVTDFDGKPRSNIVSWLDGRTEECPDENIHEIVGWPWVNGFPFAHLLRMRREEAELFEGDFRVCMNNDWINFMLTGNFVLDHSSATPFYLQDQRTFTYYKPYLEMLGLKESQLSKLVPSGTVIGNLKTELAAKNLNSNTLVIAGSFDHPSAARAVNVVNPNEMLLSCGTSWVGFRPAKERLIRQGCLCDPYMIHENGCRGEIISWGKIGLELDAWLEERYPDKENIYQQFNDDAMSNGPARDKMLEMARTFKAKAFPDVKFSRIVLAGGPSESPAWRKYIAEVWDCNIDISIYRKYTGAVGAAMLAIKGIK